MNIKLNLQFDGTEYHGWQMQQNANTVQETVKNAIERCTKENIVLIGCGRTDAGVHAENYVCNFHTNSTIPPDRYPLALNPILPHDIVCLSSETVSPEFNANRSAKSKRYVYRILNREIPDVVLRRYAWNYKLSLDVDKMREAAKYFVGEHDFIGFASSGFTVKTTVRTIYSLDIIRTGDIITIDIHGNGFLYNMVRIITGTLLSVGRGKIAPEKIPDIIASKNRKRAGITAPAQGLWLKEVYYDEGLRDGQPD